MSNTLIIPNLKIFEGEKELVIIPRQEYEVFLKWQNDISSALIKVAHGKEEYKKGKTLVLKSSKDLR